MAQKGLSIPVRIDLFWISRYCERCSRSVAAHAGSYVIASGLAHGIVWRCPSCGKIHKERASE